MISYKRYFNPNFFKQKPGDSKVFQSLSARNHVVFNSVRTGLLSVFDFLGFIPGDTVLLPAFAPHGLILPARKKKLNIVFYKLNEDLSPDNDYIEKQILKFGGSLKAIFLIHYFGFAAKIDRSITLAKQHNLIVFEDCAHTIPENFNLDNNSPGSKGDIAFFSLNKILPLPDGAIFLSNDPGLVLSNIETKNSALNFFSVRCNYMHLLMRSNERRVKSMVLKKLFSGFATFFYLIYYRLLCLLNSASPVSSITQRLLRILDVNAILKTRKSNVFYVYNQINGLQDIIFKSFAGDSHITGIPFRGNNTNDIVAKLKTKGINCLRYNKYWWFVQDKLSEIFRTEKDFHDNHFLLPVTENFDVKTLDYIVESISSLYSLELKKSN